MESNTTSIISYNTITQQILDGSISLEDITYDQFLEGREIYYSYYSARCEGYEAHHYNPVSLQIKEYNLKHPDNPIPNDRNSFMNTPGVDNRCYRLTCFEHFIAHYLLAKENPDAEGIFNIMTFSSMSNFSKGEKERVKQFINIAEIKEKSNQENSLNFKGKTMKEITGDPNWESPWKTDNPSKYYKYADDKRQYYFYNNGIVEKTFRENNIIPEGWVKGKLIRNKYHWYNNGNVNIFTVECPKGFKKGRLIKNYQQDQFHIIYPKKGSTQEINSFIKKFLQGKYGKCINHITNKKEFLKWFTDGINLYLFSVNDDIPNNFKLYKPSKEKDLIDLSTGKKHYNDGRFNIQSYIKPFNFKEGFIKNEIKKIAYNDGIKTVYFKEGDSIPQGFKKGGAPIPNRKGIKTVTGRIWSNDGVKNYYEKYIPEGCQPGRLVTPEKFKSNKGKIWSTNGIENYLGFDIPEGYWKGRTFKHLK